jgi:hypothetical protein
MAYFNHAFTKSFLATGPTQTAFPVTFPDNTTIPTTTDGGYVTILLAGVPTYGLNQLSAISVATYGAAKLQLLLMDTLDGLSPKSGFISCYW